MYKIVSGGMRGVEEHSKQALLALKNNSRQILVCILNAEVEADILLTHFLLPDQLIDSADIPPQIISVPSFWDSYLLLMFKHMKRNSFLM